MVRRCSVIRIPFSMHRASMLLPVLVDTDSVLQNPEFNIFTDA
jgi:hypothetical protein